MTHHAWVTDGSGAAIDNTWPSVGVAYAGVPFQFAFLNLRHLKRKAVVCVLDGWQENWPILGDLGDRPDEWLDPKGAGVSRLGAEREG